MQRLRNSPHATKQRNKPCFLNQAVHTDFVVRPVRCAQESLRCGVEVAGPFDALLRDHLPQCVAQSVGALHDFENACLVGKITRRRARLAALEILAIRKWKWFRRWRRRGAFALSGGRRQRVNAMRVRADLEHPFPRANHPEFGELLLRIRAPDVQRFAPQNALHLERERLRIFGIHRFDDHAVVLATRR